MDAELAELYEKHAGEVLRFATVVAGPASADDVTSLVWLRVFGTDWTGVRDPRSYLFRCVVNTSHDLRRSDERRRAREHRAQPPDTTGYDVMIRPEVRDALQRLTARQRAAVYLHYWMDLDPAEIASQLGISRRSIERELRAARALLKETLR